MSVINFFNHIKTKTLIIILVFLVGVAMIEVGAYLVFPKILKSENKPGLAGNLVNQQLPPQTTITPTSTNESVTTTKTAAEKRTIVCKDTVNFQNFDCLITAAKNCSLANISNTTRINIFGAVTESVIFYEIRGWQENKCIFYIKSIKNDIVYSQELVQKILDSGATNEQIEQQEKEMSKTAQSTAGRDGVCRFTDAAKLVDLLNKWGQGKFSSDDLKGIDCEGEYFGEAEQPVNASKTIIQQECDAQRGLAVGVTDSGTACFKNQIDLGKIVGSIKIDGKYPQCCKNK